MDGCGRIAGSYEVNSYSVAITNIRKRYLEAHHLGDISQICGVHSKNKDKTALKENMKELIVESKRLYFYTLQLLKMRKKDIDSELSKAFDIFEMCLGLKNAASMTY